MPEVEDGVHSTCLGDAKMHEALLEVVLQSALDAPGSDSWWRGARQVRFKWVSHRATQWLLK